MAKFYSSRRKFTITTTISDTQLYSCHLDTRKLSNTDIKRLLAAANTHSENMGLWAAIKLAARELKLPLIKPNQGYCPSCYHSMPSGLKVDAEKFLCCPDCWVD